MLLQHWSWWALARLWRERGGSVAFGVVHGFAVQVAGDGAIDEWAHALGRVCISHQ
jgi:hypothetical protein